MVYSRFCPRNCTKFLLYTCLTSTLKSLASLSFVSLSRKLAIGALCYAPISSRSYPNLLFLTTSMEFYLSDCSAQRQLELLLSREGSPPRRARQNSNASREEKKLDVPIERKYYVPRSFSRNIDSARGNRRSIEGKVPLSVYEGLRVDYWRE